jgi:hypothetical protein
MTSFKNFKLGEFPMLNIHLTVERNKIPFITNIVDICLDLDVKEDPLSLEPVQG